MTSYSVEHDCPPSGGNPRRFKTVTVLFKRKFGWCHVFIHTASLASALLVAKPTYPLFPTTPVLQLLNPPEEIESMADSYFQRIYTAEQSIEEVRFFRYPVVVQASAHLFKAICSKFVFLFCFLQCCRCHVNHKFIVCPAQCSCLRALAFEAIAGDSHHTAHALIR